MATKIWVGTDSGNEGKYGTAANWSPSGVPLAADDVILTDSAQNIDQDLDQSAVALTSFTIHTSYTGLIGSETVFLQIDPGILNINSAPSGGTTGAGSSRINLDLGDEPQIVTIHNGNTSATDSNRTAIRLLANDTATDIFVRGGHVSIADEPDDTSSVRLVSVANALSGVTQPVVSISEGTTIVTLTTNSGTVTLGAGATTVNANGGTLTINGSGAITTLNIRKGTVYANSTGLITTVNAIRGTISFTRNTQTRTVTNLNLSKGATVTLDKDIVTLTNKIVLADAGLMTVRAT